MKTKTPREYSKRYRELNPEKCRVSGRNWARRHRVRIAAERAAKMQNPEHAAAIRAYFHKYWKKCAAGKHIPKSLPLHREINGELVRVYRTSEVARMLPCSNAVIYKWHNLAWLPLPLIVDGRRLYQRYQVDLIGVLVCVKKRDSNTRANVVKFISENW